MIGQMMSQSRQAPDARPVNLARLEELPQAVVVHHRDLAAGDCIAPHRHRRAQLVHASAGVMAVTTGRSAFVVPPGRGVWMPAGVEHRIDARTAVAMRTLYVDPARAPGVPQDVRVVTVSPLLRELILVAVAGGNDYRDDDPRARIAQVILDQLGELPEAPLALPVPSDARLRAVAGALERDPADRRTLAEWARDSGSSERTLARLFRAETGMSFRAWRQQLRLLRALEMLAAGRPVTFVALDLGYESTSAFSAMFRRALGASPRAYLAGR
jgi:AraC-like DNA-binding protein/quercetin dioxygenase-like cupin family protein